MSAGDLGRGRDPPGILVGDLGRGSWYFFFDLLWWPGPGVGPPRGRVCARWVGLVRSHFTRLIF